MKNILIKKQNTTSRRILTMEWIEGIKLTKKYYETEASGNINLKTVKLVAATGVNRISVGSITHSATAVDFKLEI